MFFYFFKKIHYICAIRTIHYNKRSDLVFITFPVDSKNLDLNNDTFNLGNVGNTSGINVNDSEIPWNDQKSMVLSLLSQTRLHNTNVFAQFKSILMKQVNCEILKRNKYKLTKESIYCFKLFMITQKIPVIDFYDTFQLDMINYALLYYKENEKCIDSPSLLCALMTLDQMYKYRSNSSIKNESKIIQISKQIPKILAKIQQQRNIDTNCKYNNKDKNFFRYCDIFHDHMSDRLLFSHQRLILKHNIKYSHLYDYKNVISRSKKRTVHFFQDDD